MKNLIGQLTLLLALAVSSQAALAAWTCGNPHFYPNWPQSDWQGTPTHAAEGDSLVYGNNLYRANWHTSTIPGSDESWSFVRDCRAAPDDFFPDDSADEYWDCPEGVNGYPNWSQSDWQGNPHHANEGDLMHHEHQVYQARWYTASTPGSDGSWHHVGSCEFNAVKSCAETGIGCHLLDTTF